MCEKNFIDKIMDAFAGQIITREIVGKIDEIRRIELDQLEQDLKLQISNLLQKK